MVYQVPTTINSDKLPFQIIYFGIGHNQEPIVRAHDYPYYFIGFVEEGKCLLTIEDNQYNALPNQIFILNPEHKYSYKKKDDVLITDFIAFTGSLAKATLEKLEIEQGLYSTTDSESFKIYLNKLKSLYEAKKSTSEYTKVLFSLLLDLSTSLQKQEPLSYDTSNITIKKTIEFIEKNYANKLLSLDEIAENVLLSKYHLERIFKHEMNTSIIQYLLKLRLLKARHILKTEPTLLIKNVCDKCGFESSSYFIKKFKENTGYTPEQYRKMMLL